ncbi:hypothetical protein MMC15_005472 [Xylographa vitiligo]|nr:hypothetical protein [Xylographa vitiligo]
MPLIEKPIIPFKSKTLLQPFEQHLKITPTDLDETTTWAVGATVCRVHASEPRFELLILKRIPEQEAYSNCGEISSGNVDPWQTVTDADFEAMRWESSSGEMSAQLNYVVKIKEPIEVKLCPREYSQWM